MYWIHSSIILCCLGTWVKEVHHELDYSEYLGPDYKSKMREVVATSTIVSNHVSWVDSALSLIHI